MPLALVPNTLPHQVEARTTGLSSRPRRSLVSRLSSRALVCSTTSVMIPGKRKSIIFLRSWFEVYFMTLFVYKYRVFFLVHRWFNERAVLGLFNAEYRYILIFSCQAPRCVHAYEVHITHVRQNNIPRSKIEAKNAPTRSRTADLMITRITSHALYQLSYKSIHWMAPFQLMIHQFYAILPRNARPIWQYIWVETEHGLKSHPCMVHWLMIEYTWTE